MEAFSGQASILSLISQHQEGKPVLQHEYLKVCCFTAYGGRCGGQEIPIIIETLNNFQNARLHQVACGALSALADQRENAHLIVSHGGIPAILCAMDRNPMCQAFHLAAFRLLKQLTAADPTLPVTLQSGGLEIVLKVLRSNLDDATLQVSGLYFLEGIIATNKVHWSASLSQVLEAVLGAMIQHPSLLTVLQVGCGVLHRVLVHPQARPVATRLGAVEVVVEFLKRAQTGPCPVHAGLAILLQLCALEEARVAFASVAAIHVVLGILQQQCHDPVVQAHVWAIMVQASANPKVRQQLVASGQRRLLWQIILEQAPTKRPTAQPEPKPKTSSPLIPSQALPPKGLRLVTRFRKALAAVIVRSPWRKRCV
eukprot:EG_transcript_9129